MTQCKHADLMAEYAKDAMEMENPWTQWEHSYGDDKWYNFITHPSWNDKIEYRRKPKMICINANITFPAQSKVKPIINSLYYVPNVSRIEMYNDFYWKDDKSDNRFFKNGLVHLTKQAAIAHAKALISLTAFK